MNDSPAFYKDHKLTPKAQHESFPSQNILQALFENFPAAIYLVNPDYELLAVNKIRSDVLNQTAQALINRPCFQALFNLDNPCPSCRLSETFSEGKHTKRYERRQSHHDSSTDWEINTFPVYGDDHQIIQILILEQDITEKRHFENILTQSEKLAIVGQLAAGLAHELTNPLTAILANAQIIQRDLQEDNDLQELVDLILHAGERAAQVVQNLLDIARKEDFNLTPTDIHLSLERSIELIHHELVSHKVNFEFIPDHNLPTILASEDHLQSVWLNLLMNAIDSIDREPAQIRLVTRRLKDSVQINVADNGKGIPADKLKRIFEPFYTTKEPGEGTGLGLSIINRIIKQHGGSIHVISQPGIGSEFTVTLPIISTGFPYD